MTTAIEPVTMSIQLDDLTLEQLVSLSQRLGRDIDKLRADRAYLKVKIEQRLAFGERTSTEADGAAPGAVIEAAAG